MTLGDVLSKPPIDDYKQVEGFLLNKKGQIDNENNRQFFKKIRSK